jgi:low molecular weight protein-tyrosine phosphatase
LTPGRALGAAARAGEPLIGRLLGLAPIRGALRRRALRAWRASDEPLIVCLGNVNRSPFAARLAEQRAGSNASSAGFFPAAGRSSPEATVAAAAARGVELRSHRSAVVSDEQLASAPAIFIFDLENLVLLALRRRSALRRTHFLGALALSGPVLIADPHGRPPSVLEAVLEQIERAVAGGEASGVGD